MEGVDETVGGPEFEIGSRKDGRETEERKKQCNAGQTSRRVYTIFGESRRVKALAVVGTAPTVIRREGKVVIRCVQSLCGSKV